MGLCCQWSKKTENAHEVHVIPDDQLSRIFDVGGVEGVDPDAAEVAPQVPEHVHRDRRGPGSGLVRELEELDLRPLFLIQVRFFLFCCHLLR